MTNNNKLFFGGTIFFASNTTFRRGQGTLLLNDLVPHLVPHLTTQQKKNIDFVFIFFGGLIPSILKYHKTR